MRNNEYKRGSKIEYDTPGKTERADTRGNTVANEVTKAVCHTVPDDRAADILCGKEFGLNIEDIAPERALRDTVDEPDIFHRRDIGRDRKTEVTKRRNDQRNGNDVFGIIIFGKDGIGKLACRIAEEVERADHTGNGLRRSEKFSDDDDIRAVAKPADVSGRISQT